MLPSTFQPFVHSSADEQCAQAGMPGLHSSERVARVRSMRREDDRTKMGYGEIIGPSRPGRDCGRCMRRLCIETEPLWRHMFQFGQASTPPAHFASLRGGVRAGTPRCVRGTSLRSAPSRLRVSRWYACSQPTRNVSWNLWAHRAVDRRDENGYKRNQTVRQRGSRAVWSGKAHGTVPTSQEVRPCV